MPDNRNELFPDLDYGLLQQQLNVLDDNWTKSTNPNVNSDEKKDGTPSELASGEEAVDYQEFLRNMHDRTKKDKSKAQKEETKDQRIQRVRKEYEESYLPFAADSKGRKIYGASTISEETIDGTTYSLVESDGLYHILQDGVERDAVTTADKIKALHIFDAILTQAMQTTEAVRDEVKEHASGEATWRINPNAQEGGPYALASTKQASEGHCTWCNKLRDLTPVTTSGGEKHMLCSQCLESEEKAYPGTLTKTEMLTKTTEANISAKLAIFADKLRAAGLNQEASIVESLGNSDFIPNIEN